MTREDAIRIVENFELVKHFAEGGETIFKYKNSAGCITSIKRCDTILLSCLGRYEIAPPATLCPTCGQEVKEE